MKKLLKKTAINLFCLSKGVICGALVSIAPVALIHHKDLNAYFSSLEWPIMAFFFLSILCGILICFSPTLFPSRKAILALAYLFFYTACAALCQRIALTSLTVDPCQLEPNNLPSCASALTVIPGIFLICVATMQSGTASIKSWQSHPSIDQQLGHPSYLSGLLFMAGIPLIFGVWLPLIALPGAWVVTRWLD